MQILKNIEITGDSTNTSGIKFKNLSASTPTGTGATLGVDSNGELITVPTGGGGGGGDMYKSDNLADLNNYEVARENLSVFSKEEVTQQINNAVTDVTSDFYDKTEIDNLLDGKAELSDIPTKTSDLANDSGFIVTETDPTVPAWAKTPNKPSYSKSEVGLGNVDNTSDVDKPISTLQQEAIDNLQTILESQIENNIADIQVIKNPNGGITKVTFSGNEYGIFVGNAPRGGIVTMSGDKQYNGGGSMQIEISTDGGVNWGLFADLQHFNAPLTATVLVPPCQVRCGGSDWGYSFRRNVVLQAF